MNWLPDYNYILASKSPRRQQLLKSLGIDFQVRIKEVEENYSAKLSNYEIPIFLAELKSEPFKNELEEKDLLITADTVVVLENKILGKPKDTKEAKKMLKQLSGKKHQVITGVCLSSKNKRSSFYSSTNVQFKELTSSEIDFYIEQYKPFDKAGAYGIQEWIGAIGITRIEGSYSNVMGLPTQKLYNEIQAF